MNITTRYATVDDAVAIRRIQTEGWHDNNISPETGVTVDFLVNTRGYTVVPNPAKVDLTKKTIQDDPFSYLVADDAGQVVGWIRKWTKDGASGFGIYIDRAYRAMGIGTLLIQRFLDENECTDLQISVTKSNTKGIRFYERFGFHIVGEVNEYFDDAKTIYLPTIIMQNYE